MRGKLTCPDACGLELNVDFKKLLTEIEKQVGFELFLNSGPRCPKYNALVTQNVNSAHTLGLAADVAVADSHQRYLLIKAIYGLGVKRVGRSDKHMFIHLDIASGPLPHPTDSLKEYPLAVDWKYD